MQFGVQLPAILPLPIWLHKFYCCLAINDKYFVMHIMGIQIFDLSLLFSLNRHIS